MLELVGDHPARHYKKQVGKPVHKGHDMRPDFLHLGEGLHSSFGSAADDAASVKRRLAEARREIEVGRASYDEHVVNEDLDRAVESVTQIIEKRRADP